MCVLNITSHWTAIHCAAPVCAKGRTYTHGAAEKQDDIPWDIFKFLDGQHLEYKE